MSNIGMVSQMVAIGNFRTKTMSVGWLLIQLRTKGLFLLQQGWPLVFSEFGFDMSGTHIGGNHYLTFLRVAAEMDLDWAIWALQGSYYIREDILAYDESYEYHGTGVQLEIPASLKGLILCNHHFKVLVCQTAESHTM